MITARFAKSNQETREHALFECPRLENLRKYYKLKSLTIILVDKSSISTQFATNVLVTAWENEVLNTMDYLNETNSRWTGQTPKLDEKTLIRCKKK